MDEQKTWFDRFTSRVKNNPFVATLIFLGTIIIALSTFTNAAKNLWGLVDKDERPAVNGTWKAEVAYDWDNANYTETFTFKGNGQELYGTASFLGVKRGILEGRAAKDRLEFITKTQEVLNNDETKDVVHRYRGSVVGDEITFVMQSEGGFTEHVPIEFTATKEP